MSRVFFGKKGASRRDRARPAERGARPLRQPGGSSGLGPGVQSGLPLHLGSSKGLVLAHWPLAPNYAIQFTERTWVVDRKEKEKDKNGKPEI